ncbi:unnamed protein product [Mytilus edulis]|uniref:Endonuclease/exonuclease/phosphatase domain-containing protein n=1 Tax=Mytilus edulis TaxID=6550 RepID=A0A8S3PNH8_MYTED|nr:unnamed protein product [Mytilus edulis]
MTFELLQSLNKSTVQVFHHNTKLITITIYYSTKRCLVQGNSCQKWVEKEFFDLKECINNCIKEDNSKINIDNVIRQLQNSNIPIEAEYDENEETTPKLIEETTPKQIDESSDESLQPQNDKNNNENIKQNNNFTNTMNTESENQQVVYAFHSLENKLIDCHLQYSEKIDHLATLIIIMEEKLILQAKEQEELRNKNMELSKINKRLANIEEHINKNSIDIARTTNTIEKSVSDIRNPAYDKEQSEKLSNIQDTLTKVEKLCATVSTNTVEDQQKEKNQIYDKPSTNQSHEQITTRSKQRRDNFQVTETRDQDQSKNNPKESHSINLWIVGSSVVKDLRKNRIYRYKKTNITTLHDKTIRGASEFLLTGKLKANNIAFQVGSNDLEESTPEDVAKNMERLILDTQRLVPGSNIIINAILPRFYRNAHSSKTYESKRSKCNSMLSDLCNEYSLKFVKHENFVQFHFTDGIHLNQNDGIPLYVRNLKHVVNPLLGVINDQQNFENHQFPRQRNQQFRRENGNHFYKHPNPYDERPNRYDEENHQSATYMYDNSNNFYERETNHQNASHDKHNNYYQSYDDNLSNNGINMRLLKLALEETWKGESKEYTIPGFNTISKIRKKNKRGKRYSGGIIIFYKNSIHQGLTYVKNGSLSNNRLWLKLDKNFFGLSDDIYICAVYIPPVSSTHYDDDFLQLEKEINIFSKKGKVVLLGDFNSRTGDKLDYIKDDSLDINNFAQTNLLPDEYKIDNCFNRYSCDKVVNGQGVNLLDLSTSSSLRILNGRYIGDIMGNFTYETVLNNILNFEMQTFSNDQRGVDDETNKLTTILCNLAENSCVIKRKNFKKSKPKNKQPWSDNAITDLKHQINAIGRNIKANPFDKTYKTRYFNLLKTFKKMIKQKKT